MSWEPGRAKGLELLALDWAQAQALETVQAQVMALGLEPEMGPVQD